MTILEGSIVLRAGDRHTAQWWRRNRYWVVVRIGAETADLVPAWRQHSSNLWLGHPLADLVETDMPAWRVLSEVVRSDGYTIRRAMSWDGRHVVVQAGCRWWRSTHAVIRHWLHRERGSYGHDNMGLNVESIAAVAALEYLAWHQRRVRRWWGNGHR